MDMTKCSILANMLLTLIWLVVLVALFIRDKMQHRRDADRRGCSGRQSACTTPHQSATPTASPRGETFGITATALDAGVGIDLSGKRRETFRLVLPDGDVLHLYTPTKMVAELFAGIGEILQRVARGRSTPEDGAELYRLSALVLGNNAERVQVDAQSLFDRLTLDDIADVLSSYMDWLTALIESKN